MHALTQFPPLLLFGVGKESHSTRACSRHRYRRFAGSKRRLQNEQFIELFDVDLVHVPDEAPYFLR